MPYPEPEPAEQLGMVLEAMRTIDGDMTANSVSLRRVGNMWRGDRGGS